MLEALASSSGGLGVRDLARLVGIAPSTAQRILASLTGRGFTEQEASRKYRIGLRAFAVGNAFLSGNTLVREAMGELQQLADEHQLNAYLGVREDRSIVYLLTVQSSGPIVIKGSPGTRTFLHTTTLGKALLADLDDAQIKALLGAQPYRRLTPKTKTRLAPLLTELHAVRANGYAVSDEENLLGVYAVGAAIRDASGNAVAAISGALPRHQVERTTLSRVSRHVCDAAERISARLGARPAGRKEGRSSRVSRTRNIE
jgi:DNA-binding IclR family transcriptional regulator